MSFAKFRFPPKLGLSSTKSILYPAFAAFFAATIALVQDDIKKIIAYSTCSQLGYMFFATGVGAILFPFSGGNPVSPLAA